MRGESKSRSGTRATTEAEFGKTPRIPATGFIVFGLLTFWAYTALRLGLLVNEHAESRWRELRVRLAGAGVPLDRMERLRQRGFRTSMRVPAAAATLFVISEILIVSWCASWAILGAPDVAYMLSILVAASASFYLATLLFVIWLARRIHDHEVNELAIRERGPEIDANDRIVPDETMVARWEDINNHVSLFLIVAFAIAGSPIVAALLFLSGASAAYPGIPALLVLMLGGACHYWGTKLTLSLFNSHLAQEATHGHGWADEGEPGVRRETAALSGQGFSAASDKQAVRREESERFIFVSYKREDFERVHPLVLQIEGWGYRIWYDGGIPGGAEWDALIEDKLKHCSMLLFFISRGSAESKYCRREVKYVDQLNKPILSLRLESAHLGHGLEMLLTQNQIIDTDAADFAGQLERALRFLAGAKE